ncbi:hypothetical protein DK419_13335 [Methylobacterium terrae]|uniref:Uncharacterized protein n=1 Tax=Methylobacterium terrae TaxID=2202827 RepID=A0A2U8WNU0_9HYPH|nr:hypothetical protein [Methylobacterium terrae]AWN47178.1 hypothetical protein DK419_13335 [Methylobacterium terrae]
MSDPVALFDVTRQQMLAELGEFSRRHGMTEAGVVAEAVVASCAAFVRDNVGPEAAFSMLTRHADAAAEPLLSSDVHPSQPE